MRRLNVKLLLVLFISSLVLMVGVHVLHGVQVVKNADVTRKQAEAKWKEKQWEPARKLYDQYVKQTNDDDQEPYYQRAKLAMEIAELPGATDRDRELAYRALQDAVLHGSSDRFVHENLANFELGQIRAHPAMARSVQNHLEEALKGDPDDKELIVKLARVEIVGLNAREQALNRLAKLTGYDRAAKTFTRPETPAPLQAYYLLAMLVGKMSAQPDLAAADAIIEEMIQTQPQNAQAYFTKFDWLATQRQPGKAEKKEVYEKWDGDMRAMLTKAAELSPNEKSILLTRLELALNRNEIPLANELAAKGMKDHSTERRFYIMGAETKIRERKPEEATEILLKGLAALPRAVELHFELALNYLRMNKIPEGRKAAEGMREISGQSNPFQRLRSAFLQAQLALVDEKPAVAESLLTSQRENLASHADEWQAKNWASPNEMRRQLGLTHQSLAQLYVRRGAWDRALPHFEAWARNDPRNAIVAEAGYWKCQKNLGHVDDAIRAYRKLREQNEQLFFAYEDLWRPAFTAMVDQQAALPDHKRDWREVDDILQHIRKNERLTLPDKEQIEGMVDRVRGRPKEAREKLEGLVKLNPKNEDAWTQLVVLDLTETGVDAAFAAWDRASAALGDSIRMRLLKGNLIVRKQGATMRKELKDLEVNADKFEKKPRVELLKALANLQYYGAKDVDEAQRLMREASALDPSDTLSQWALFEYARDREDLDAVTQIAEEIRNSQGTNSQDWQLAEATRLMLIMAKQGRPDSVHMPQARTLLIEIQRRRPNWFEANLLEAQLSFLEGNMDQYLANLLECVDPKKNGKPSPPIVQRAVPLLLQQGKIELAETTLNIIPEEQRGTELRQLSVAVQMAKQNTTAALAEAKQMMGAKADARMWLWYGSILNEAKQPREAGEALAKAVELAPGDPDTHLAYMEYLVNVDPSLERARSQLQQMEIKLESKRRAFALGIGHFLLGDPTRSEDFFREAKAEEPDNIGLRRAIAQFYLLKRGYQNKASDELTSMLSMPTTPGDEANRWWARRQLSLIRAATGVYWQQKEALDLLEQNRVDGVLAEEDQLQKARILASRPDSDSRRKAIAILERSFVDAKRPLNLGEQLMLASLYEQVGNWGKSAETIRSIVSTGRNKDNPDVVSLYVKLSIKHDDLATAASWQDALEKLQPNADMTKALRAQLLHRQGKQAQALNILRDMVPKPVTREKAGLAVRVAELMVTLKFYDDAESLYQEYVRLVPDGRLVLADFMGRYRDLQACLDICEEVLGRLSPDRNSTDWMKVLEVAVYTLRARQSAVTPAQMDKVASWIKRGKDANPDSYEYELKWAEYLELTAQYAEVKKVYRALLDKQVKKSAGDNGLAPELRAVTLNNMAYLLAIEEPTQADAALPLVTEAISILGPIRDLLDTRGIVYLRQRKTREALADFNDVLLDHNARDLDDRTFGLKYFHMALAQFANNDLAAAEKSMGHVEKLKLTAEDLPTGERESFQKLRADLDAIRASRDSKPLPETAKTEKSDKT